MSDNNDDDNSPEKPERGKHYKGMLKTAFWAAAIAVASGAAAFSGDTGWLASAFFGSVSGASAGVGSIFFFCRTDDVSIGAALVIGAFMYAVAGGVVGAVVGGVFLGGAEEPIESVQAIQQEILPLEFN